ncbi:MAG: hypothetical protein JW833_17365 [Prolixibacteraceae bacterium]|nr:hypothetical protein [Prolixibacteraceae bacterium]MBN2745476.1 hypothetical protein [Bacteroidales bacterium]
MKKKYSNLIILTILFMGFLIPFQELKAQEKDTTSPFSVNIDFYTGYVWRGTLFSGPSVQPSLSWQHKGLKIGGWASQDFAGTYNEADLYVTYSFNFGLSLGITDYYYPGLSYSDSSETTGSHAYEINLVYTIGKLSLAANYVLNKAGGAASAGADTYVELKYNFKNIGIFAGVGNGWLTIEEPGKGDKFGLVNIGASISKEIKITDKLSIPLNGSVIWNPQAEQFYIVAGFSL